MGLNTKIGIFLLLSLILGMTFFVDSNKNDTREQEIALLSTGNNETITNSSSFNSKFKVDSEISPLLKEVMMTKDEILVSIIMKKLREYHFLKLELNDEFSNKVFDLYLKEIDFNKKFLLESDVKQLKFYRNLIDGLLAKGSLEFFDLSYTMISRRIKDVEENIHSILSKPFSFDKKEYIEFDQEKLSFPKNQKSQKQNWHKTLKYRVLQTIYNKQKQEKKEHEKDAKKKLRSIKELEVEARKEVLENQLETFERLSKLERKDWLSIYLNSVTAVYDPHTNYLPPADKENFDINMSGRLQGIGARLSDKDGYVTVASIVPGSPCWKQGDLAVGDKILKVGQGSEEPKNVMGMRTDQAVQFIRGKKGTEVRLTVEHLDGTIEEISIIRDIIELEETYVKKAMVNNIGYIYLPRFYADFNGTGGPGCAEDVAKAIDELKKENVEGIVLDLRNNGGGSLAEVVDMTGLFIEKGPVVQVKINRGKAQLLEDRDNRVQYNGPLIVMVNSFSASASEILAAAIQDYERGLIIGLTPSTYGKGTVQRALDLDRNLGKDIQSIRPLGALKLTTQKFYRIDGGATQLKGVIPDIVLPSVRSYIKYGEKEQTYAIPWDKISPVEYTKWPSLNGRIDAIKENSKKRVENDELFSKIDKYALRTKKLSEQTKYSLILDEYKMLMKSNEKEAEEYENLFKDIKLLDVKLASMDQYKYQKDTNYAAKVDRWFKGLKKDIYVSEAINVIHDME